LPWSGILQGDEKMPAIYPFIAGAGSFARLGKTYYLYPAELAGITLMFIGFLMAKELTGGKK